MRNKEQILSEIEAIKRENIINEDRKQHFSNKGDNVRIEMYERLITKNNKELDVLNEELKSL